MYRTSSTSTLAEVAKDHGNVNKAGSFVNGLDIYEYHYSFKDTFGYDYDHDDLNGRRLLHGDETTVALQGLVVTTAFTTPWTDVEEHSANTNVLRLYGTIYLETLGTWFQDC